MKRDRIETLKANAKLGRAPARPAQGRVPRPLPGGSVSSGAVIRSLIIDYLMDRPRRWSTRLSRLKEAIMKRSK